VTTRSALTFRFASLLRLPIPATPHARTLAVILHDKLMTLDNKISIPISKTKLTLMLIGSLIFATLGTVYIKDPEVLMSPMFRSKELIFIVGIACTLFFGLASFYLFKKLFDNRPGLIISADGILDNSNATPVGLIEWNDIVNTGTIKIHRQRIILIKVKNAEKYINRQKNKRTRNVLTANNNFFGTPITITANGLKIDFETLERILCKNIKQYRQ
jgi:hypothetical protein